MYCKEKWCSAARKGPLSGRVGSFQMHSINKMRRFQDLKSAAKLRQGRLVPVGRSREIARRCTYHTQRKSCGNTGLLTCVREQMLLRPHPTFSQVSLQWRTFRPGDSIASAWPRAHSTVSCRPCGLLPCGPCRRTAGAACITVSIRFWGSGTGRFGCFYSSLYHIGKRRILQADFWAVSAAASVSGGKGQSSRSVGAEAPKY